MKHLPKFGQTNNKFFARLFGFLAAACITLGVAYTLLPKNQQVASASSSHSSYSSDDYKYAITAYALTYDIKANRTMKITEDVTVLYGGSKSTGMYRDIPVNGGESLTNMKAYELVGGVETAVDYTVEYQDEFLSFNVGDTRLKTGESHTYRFTYDYATTAQEGANKLSLNVVGYGSTYKISNISVTLNLPEGLIPADTVCYVMRQNDPLEPEVTKVAAGNTTITLKKIPSDKIAYYTFGYSGNTITFAYTGTLNEFYSNTGITFDFYFEDGVLSTSSKAEPYLFMIGGIVLILLVFVVYRFGFNKDQITPVVNVRAPHGLDPLMMGKLIDNRVNKEDITSLIYYWANKGYLKINLDNQDDPVLIRIVQYLPEGTPSYQVTMFNGLFRNGEVVKTSSLKNVFYKTVEAVTHDVNERTKGLYTSKSIVISILLAVISGLFIGFAPFLYAKLAIHATLNFYFGFVMVIPAIIVYALTETAMYYRLKNSTKIFTLQLVGILLMSVVISLIYAMVQPTALFPTAAMVLVSTLCNIAVMLSVKIVSRTPSYTEQLNDIMGFRNFIATAEKERLEAMLEEDPTYFYEILPYAQVLNVTDIWEKKFADLTVEPPQWLVGNTRMTFVNYVLLSQAMRLSTAHMASTMVSRPSSTGKSGGIGGFGGGVGGGHGGGGFRGR